MKDFKQTFSSQKAAANPVLHFARLTQRELPDVMPHQKAILETYAELHENDSDVALQLPTGSGKTLVGLLIADWRRQKNKEKVVYLCPTIQLVKQTVHHAQNSYGIEVVDLSGSKDNFSPADRTAYLTARKVAVIAYNGLFNINPFFKDPNIVIVDDTHTAENYVANMWTLSIETNTELHNRLTEFLRNHISSQDYDRLRGNWFDSADATWVEKIPSTVFAEIETDMRELIDAYLGNIEGVKNKDQHFRWSMIRNRLSACHLYLASREILLRPLIPPTFDHAPFAGAKQRIFMSATLGAGGDLERLTGRKRIKRLPAPEGFETSGVGRRFFILPLLSLTPEETEHLQTRMQKHAGRSVVLTPSKDRAKENIDKMRQSLPSWDFFGNEEIEKDKSAFVNLTKAVAVLANRYDGIDFPKEQCRLLCIDGLPQATNSQEKFILSKMGSRILYDERIQTRVFQATGRCTRALEDRSVVLVTDSLLTDYLVSNDRAKHFPPTLQSELDFGEENSTELTSEDIFGYFQMFMENKEKWARADNQIREKIAHFEQISLSYIDELSAAVEAEIDYQQAMWNQDFQDAFAAALKVLSKLTQPELRGYRALWHYLAGSVVAKLSLQKNDRNSQIALTHFEAAKKAAPNVTWLKKLSRSSSSLTVNDTGDGVDLETARQVEALELNFVKLGIVTNQKFEKVADDILNKLNSNKLFESAQKDLGDLLGFMSSNGKGDAAPDCWWLGDKVGLVFEDHAGGKATTILGSHKALQAANHTKWLNESFASTKTMDICPIIVTPCVRAGDGALPQLAEVKYWKLDHFRDWASKAVATIREIKGTFHQEGDLVWRSEASKILETQNLTINSIVDLLPIAKKALGPEKQ